MSFGAQKAIKPEDIRDQKNNRKRERERKKKNITGKVVKTNA